MEKKRVVPESREKPEKTHLTQDEAGFAGLWTNNRAVETETATGAI